MAKMIICAVCGNVEPHHSKGMCKRCYGRQYQAANKTHIREKRKQWEEDNKEGRAAYNKQWRADHPEHDREQYLKHTEKKKALSRRWRIGHPGDGKQYREDHPDYEKQWRADHPTYAKEYRREHPKEPRDYITPAGQCSQLNIWFEGCRRHHVSTDEIIHIPAEMHISIWHNIRTGVGMDEINRMAFAFLNGQRNASAQMTISDF